MQAKDTTSNFFTIVLLSEHLTLWSVFHDANWFACWQPTIGHLGKKWIIVTLRAVWMGRVLNGRMRVRAWSDQIRSVPQSCPTLCDPMNRSTPGLPIHHQLPEFTQTHVHRVSDAIQPSHPLSSPSPLAPNPSQHQSLFLWVNSSLEVAKVLDFQL